MSYFGIIEGFEAVDSILKELRVRPVINASGTVTTLGGCLLADDVLNAAREAAKIYVDMTELHEKAGSYLAQLVGAEAAYVTSGAAAGLVLSVGACIAHGDADLMSRLPKTGGMRNEIVVQKLHRNMYDHNLEVAGARIKEIGSRLETTRRDLENGINRNTAAVVYFVFDPQLGVLRLHDVIQIAHNRGIPVIADAAAELPPKQNLTKFLSMGADLVLFSGGKDIGAPNDSGVIFGKKNLVRLCMRLGPQSYEKIGSKTRVYIGRPMKTSKEDIFAVVAAMRRYLRTDHNQRLRDWEGKADRMVHGLSRCNALKVSKIIPGVGHNRPVCIPRVQLEFQDGHTSAEDFLAKLKGSDPPVYAYTMDGRLYLNPQCLEDGEEEIVVRTVIRLVSNSSSE